MAHAPAADQRFILDHIVDFAGLAGTDRFRDATPDVTAAILTEAARLCDEVVAPVNRDGDLHPARLENGVLRSSPGFDRAYRGIAEGGWVGVSAAVEYGGMGLPHTLATCVNEMLAGACLSLQLKPLLSQGQIEALEHHASDDLKALYLPKLISGEWSGTMNLTEPQAGSDVGALRCRAEPDGDGTYRVTGQKIFITWGDSDLVPNVCHLVLARLPDAAPGTKGISLFLVPKFLPDEGGNPGVANSLRVVSLEHKLGIHGSPTCVMEFQGAKGWLVDAPGKGMAAMFTMMNNARLGVGMQGVGVAEAALQKAVAFAAERVQGKTPDGSPGIIGHADVRRMLAEARAEVFSARVIGLACARAIDMATATGDGDCRARAALLTPIAKAYGTDIGIRVADLGVQVHGGMGFIEETGAAQYLRDARITAIYEGTNGIQAMDLVGRKLADGGEAALRLIAEIESDAAEARAHLPDLAGEVWQSAENLREATEALLAMDLNDRFAGAVPYLHGFALVLGGHAHLRAALADAARLPLARVMIRRLLPGHAPLLAVAREGASGLYDVGPELLGA
ncbi:acyl-CoA dehydrogenase [Pseudogemmobacter humi]|uniref:3-methylmercaptopropionyl-CoA dehydrogenase n=1 Tax=Pseudogemmobacter humi TaxID=2483812 RepID=A0A3P5WR60_9RHOB|nr:acyl-CoA dehydrogenase [Pseudogemmobacter humi]VDC23602.1 Acyl-CoA dehydrogenase, short-chain specific [Pseudogemmobacter humi]